MVEKSKKSRLFLIFIQKNKEAVTHAFDVFFNGIKSEGINAKKTSLIIQNFATKGEISKEDEKFLKFYVVDLLKIAGIGIPFVLLPGASIIIPFVLKMAEKKNLDLIPSNFKSKTKKGS